MRGCLIISLLVASCYGHAQDSLKVEKSLLFDPNKIEADFLFGYYDQEGQHSAVIGGIGTEDLEDRDFKIVVRAPIDSVRRVTFRPNVNYYTSASTDRIDSRTSASKADFRTQIYFDYEKVNPIKRRFWKFSAGGSGESDYASRGLQLAFTQFGEDMNHDITINGSAFFDEWVMIFPEELRTDSAVLPIEDTRNSYALGTTYTRILNRRMRGSLSTGITYQTGLLSTPFHRTYFVGERLPRVEKLPNSRIKIPLTGQLNYFVIPEMILKLWARGYWDDFGVRAGSIRLETIGKLNPFLSAYGFLRLHSQFGSEHFAPFREHFGPKEFYTSDYDLSTFQSRHWGLGLRWKPLLGIAKLKILKWPANFQMINLRYGRYVRSDGLSSHQILFALGFILDKQVKSVE